METYILNQNQNLNFKAFVLLRKLDRKIATFL